MVRKPRIFGFAALQGAGTIFQMRSIRVARLAFSPEAIPKLRSQAPG